MVEPTSPVLKGTDKGPDTTDNYQKTEEKR